jgi:type II secretory pathway pseudopilin PulG
LTLIELLMALAITGMVSAAISAMWSAIAAGERSRRDNRAYTIRTFTARSRLAAYVAPSRCVLHAEDDMLVLWLDDARESGTVNVSELRWLIGNKTSGEIEVHFVRFPAGMADSEKAIRDEQCALSQDWRDKLAGHYASGEAVALTIVDGIDNAEFGVTTTSALDASDVKVVIRFLTDRPDEVITQDMTFPILHHVQPLDP